MMKFPFVLHGMLRGWRHYWPLMLMFVPFGFIAGFYGNKLRHKWLLLMAPVLYVVGEVWAWLNITGVLGEWGIHLKSPQAVTRYLLCFIAGELLGILVRFLKKKA